MYDLTSRELAGIRRSITLAAKKGPEFVVDAARRAVAVFDAKGWPDNWASVRNQCTDALDWTDTQRRWDVEEIFRS